MKRNAPFWILIVLLAILAVNALSAGFIMMRDPTGKALQFPEGSLANTPFSDYFWPGLLLFVFMGALPALSIFLLFRKPVAGWWLALISGFGLIIWILVQMTMVPYFILQPILLVWGALVVLVCIFLKKNIPILNRKGAR